MTHKVSSYIAGAWITPEDEGTPILDASTGEVIATFSPKQAFKIDIPGWRVSSASGPVKHHLQQNRVRRGTALTLDLLLDTLAFNRGEPP